MPAPTRGSDHRSHSAVALTWPTEARPATLGGRPDPAGPDEADHQPESSRAFVGSWRRGRDLNPRYGCPYAAFRVRCDRPLCHLSGSRTGGAYLEQSAKKSTPPDLIRGWNPVPPESRPPKRRGRAVLRRAPGQPRGVAEGPRAEAR